MHAIICPRYGAPNVLRSADLALPEPKRGEIRIKVHATTVSAADCRIRGLRSPPGYKLIARLALGINGPRQKVLGGTIAGVVDEIGDGVETFVPGMRVLAALGRRMGGYSEAACVPANGRVVELPYKVSFADAVALPFGFITARHFLVRKGELTSNERLLINGASGAVGLAMVQIAKAQGAHVTGVCSAANAKLVRSLGADETIDYAAVDLRSVSQSWDMVADNVGNIDFKLASQLLTDGGRHLMVVDTLSRTVAAPLISRLRKITIISGIAVGTQADMEDMIRMAASGTYFPVIDQIFSIDEVVSAHTRAEMGHKVGNIVLIREIPEIGGRRPATAAKQ